MNIVVHENAHKPKVGKIQASIVLSRLRAVRAVGLPVDRFGDSQERALAIKRLLSAFHVKHATLKSANAILLTILCLSSGTFRLLAWKEASNMEALDLQYLL